MPRENVRRTPGRESFPKQFEQAQKNQYFTSRQEERRNDIARPMRPQINSRVTDRSRDKEIEPAALSKKQHATKSNDRVVRDVTGRKRGSGLVLIGLIGVTNGRLFEKRHELRPRFLQYDHAHTLHLLGSMPTDRIFETVRGLFGDNERDEQTTHECPPVESAENDRINSDPDEKGFPNLDVAERGHEQIERRVRPLFVDKMKKRLIHASSLEVSCR
jgi:hypothetical protein